MPRRLSYSAALRAEKPGKIVKDRPKVLCPSGRLPLQAQALLPERRPGARQSRQGLVLPAPPPW
jgi:hypothetical protein